MKKNLANAVKLPSSIKVFGHDDDSFEESVLFSLLEESCKRKLSNKTKIIITDEYIPDNISIPETADLRNYIKLKKSTITFAGLKEIYKRYWKVDYSSEVEDRSKSSHLEDLKKEGEKIWAWLPYQVHLRENSKEK
ncbi:MAG: hypothetical protein Q8O84_01470 [Nanoarchaeota archaeon]|nr:hypothetical protein [Nanoarchaeota archaeon]